MTLPLRGTGNGFPPLIICEAGHEEQAVGNSVYAIGHHILGQRVHHLPSETFHISMPCADSTIAELLSVEAQP
jgi:hypothetical protein